MSEDATAVRKMRMNADLIIMFQQPCPVGATSSIQGVGLYTHVQDQIGSAHEHSLHPKAQFLAPRCLSNGDRMARFEPELTDDVKSVWEELRDTVKKEGEILGNQDYSLEELKHRYGALDIPVAIVPARSMDNEQQLRRHKQDAALQEDIARHENLQGKRRISLGDYIARSLSSENPVTGPAEPARRASASGIAIPTRNNYEASRDPRLQGRS